MHGRTTCIQYLKSTYSTNSKLRHVGSTIKKNSLPSVSPFLRLVSNASQAATLNRASLQAISSNYPRLSPNNTPQLLSYLTYYNCRSSKSMAFILPFPVSIYVINSESHCYIKSQSIFILCNSLRYIPMKFTTDNALSIV